MSGVEKVVCCFSNMMIPVGNAIPVKQGGEEVGFADKNRLADIIGLTGIKDWAEGIILDHLDENARKKFFIQR